jgi:hypothetical protein
MNLEDVKHHYRVIDMMLTMHSVLRDHNAGLSLVTDVLLLCSSVLLCSFVFIDPKILSLLTIAPELAQTVVGGSSIIVFIISLVQLRVDWKEKAEKHSQACDTLSRLRGKCRDLLKAEQAPEEQIKDLCTECTLTLRNLPKVPERKFHALKLYHQRKILLSKMIDSNPGSPLILLRLRIWFNGIRSRDKTEKSAGGNDASV